MPRSADWDLTRCLIPIFSADLTILEEANELIERVQNGGTLPLITSCSPGWVKFCEHYYPDMIENLSSCKSPQQMFGAITKTYYAEKMGLDPKNIVVVSIMPCTAKKFEVGREDQAAAGVPDVDIALTTRELARMIERAGLMFTELPDEEFDAPLGTATAGGGYFGATGWRIGGCSPYCCRNFLTGEKLESVDFKEVRGTDGIKGSRIYGSRVNVRVAVASAWQMPESC